VKEPVQGAWKFNPYKQKIRTT